MDDGVTEIKDLVSSDQNNVLKQEEEKGGVINDLISNLMSSRPNLKIEDEKMAEEENSGGILNDLISGILHKKDLQKNEKYEDGGNDKLDSEDSSSNYGGLIDNLVSHLPSPLSDGDASAPATDEASILIHSIVHD